MNSRSENKLHSPKISSLLAELRSRIRKIVCLEGMALAIIWVTAMFWIEFALDYGPVTLGIGEMPFGLRLAILILVGSTTAYIIYRWILKRVFVNLRDESMALLLEQKFPEFGDSLVTSVELNSSSNHDKNLDTTSLKLLEQTREKAERLVENVELNKVLNTRPMRWQLSCAGLLVVSIITFWVARPATLGLAAQRLYLLDSKTWPRVCQIEVIGIKVKRENLIEGIPELSQTKTLKNNAFRVARGSDITLLVRAAASDDRGAKLPENCSLRYWNETERGQQPLKKIGTARNGYQMYSLDGLPLTGILKSFTFDIRGGDHRIGPFEITVVNPPAIESTDLACVFPDYMVHEPSNRWTPRTERWTGQLQLPRGTDVNVIAKANKPLQKVYAYDANNKSMTEIAATSTGFEFPIDALNKTANFQFFLYDQDEVLSEIPHSIAIEPVDDTPPTVLTGLKGIGTAVTPDVRIPVIGKITDDYGVKEQWVEVETSVTDNLRENFSTDIDGNVSTAIDFKEKKQDANGFTLSPGNEETISVVVKAQDAFDLSDEPNEGVGDRYVLDVVTPGELLRILERLEVGQRRLLDHIYQETADARDYLVRSKSKTLDNAAGFEPGDKSESNSDDLSDSEGPDSDDEIRSHELRLLFSQRGVLQVDKSTQEIVGVINAFENIRLQLINNRIDSEDRKLRLSDQIISPLRLIADESLQQLRDEISELEVSLRDLQTNPKDRQLSDAADAQAIRAIETTDRVLEQINAVLGILVKYETQNELLDVVRRMIELQKDLNEQTKSEANRKAFEGLLDDD